MTRRLAAVKKRIQNLQKLPKSTKTTIEEVPDEYSSSDFITDLEEDSDDGWEEGDNEIIGRFQILENEGLAEWDEDDLEDDDEEAATEIKNDAALSPAIPWSSDSSKFYTTGAERGRKRVNKLTGLPSNPHHCWVCTK
ncbi:hypothetical protein JB92DRAFT_2825615 [Gautieria morchelliformis]|nr:hypothetical protein JB92DRAFT_2825615 [Gautieria morchelliformis]